MPQLPSTLPQSSTKNTPPTDDPSLASYECPAYKAQYSTWMKAKDCWKGSLQELPMEKAEMYLPRNYKEPEPSYKARLKRSQFDNRFRRIIQGYSGAFSKFDFTGSEPNEEFMNDCDQKGSSFKAFFDALCSVANRDKYAFVLVNFTPLPKDQPSPRNRAEEARLGRRPFINLVEASQIINWSFGSDRQPTHFTIKEKRKKEAKKYGAIYETVYRVIERDNWRLVRMISPENNGKSQWTEETIDEGQYLGKNGKPVSRIPLIPISMSTLCWWDADEPFPFSEVADLNIVLYQEQSDRREIQHKLVPTVALAPGPGAKLFDMEGNLTIGPNTPINLGTNGNAFVLEASGSGIPYLFQAEEKDVEMMRAVSLEFVTNAGPEKREVQIKLDLQDLQNNLERMANMLESSMQSIFALLEEYTGEKVKGISIAVDMSVFLFNVTDIAAAVAGKFLSQETAVRRMQQIGYNEDAEEELKRIQSEQARETSELANALKPNINPDEEEEL